MNQKRLVVVVLKAYWNKWARDVLGMNLGFGMNVIERMEDGREFQVIDAAVHNEDAMDRLVRGRWQIDEVTYFVSSGT